MGTTWTIEWWNKSAKASSSGDLLTVMCQNFAAAGIDILYQQGFKIQNGPILAPEPTPSVWTHVALVSDGTALKLYYNGVSVYSGGAWNLANTADAIRIGARGPAAFQLFDGQLALIRISNTAKYLTTFTPTTTYSVEADTKLFLGSDTPLVDTSVSARTITNNGVTISTNFPSTLGSQSLLFNQPEGDFLSTPASADWNLGNNWTMEFWMNANNSSNAGINIPGGQWGLINQGGWYGGMPDDNCILVGLAAGNLTINQSANGDIQFVEPAPNVWTHVAVVNNGGGSEQKVYYNGVEQSLIANNYQTNGKTNTTADLYIGRLSNQYADYSSHFDGKMALIRISNAAKYLAAFAPTTTYGVEADTILFLGSSVPWADTSVSAHFITNNGVTISTDVPNILFPLPGSANPISYSLLTTEQQGVGYLDPGGYLASIPGTAVIGSLIRRGYWGNWANPSSSNNDHPEIFAIPPLQTLADSSIDFGNQSLDANYYCMEWKGYFKPSFSQPSNGGPWNFQVAADDVCMLWIGNAALTPTNENWTCNSGVNNGLNLQSPTLVQDQWYPIRIRYQEWAGNESCGVFAATVGWYPLRFISNDPGSIGYNATTDGY